MQLLKVSVLTIAALVGFATGSARAGLVTITNTVTGSGVLNGTAYTNAFVTLSFVGDTVDISPKGGGFFNFGSGTSTVTVAGVGTATFAVAMVPFVSQTSGPGPGIAGFSVYGTGTLLATFGSVFGTYDLSTSIGPITGDSFIRPDLTFATTNGSLRLTQTSSRSTYTAIVATTVVPEPSTIVLAGVAGLVTLARARRKHLNG